MNTIRRNWMLHPQCVSIWLLILVIDVSIAVAQPTGSTTQWIQNDYNGFRSDPEDFRAHPLTVTLYPPWSARLEIYGRLRVAENFMPDDQALNEVFKVGRTGLSASIGANVGLQYDIVNHKHQDWSVLVKIGVQHLAFTLSNIDVEAYGLRAGQMDTLNFDGSGTISNNLWLFGLQASVLKRLFNANSPLYVEIGLEFDGELSRAQRLSAVLVGDASEIIGPAGSYYQANCNCVDLETSHTMKQTAFGVLTGMQYYFYLPIGSTRIDAVTIRRDYVSLVPFIRLHWGVSKLSGESMSQRAISFGLNVGVPIGEASQAVDEFEPEN